MDKVLQEGEVPDSLQPSYVSYDFSTFPPMGILAIAANVDPRHDLKVLDCLTKKMSIDDTVNFNSGL